MSYCVDLETNCQATLQQLRAQHQSSLRHREEHIASLADQLARLKQENSALLASISKANRLQGPINIETYYVDQFDSLNHLIQSSVAGMFKWSCSAELSDDAISKVIKFLDSIEPCGKHTLDMLKTHNVGIATLHENAARRIALVRHLIALLLWDRVLRRFAFGLDVDVDKNLCAIEYELISGNSS